MEIWMKDKKKPLFHWYVDSALGKELVLALYTRPCRYGKCTFCVLPTMAAGGEKVTATDIEKQIDFILSNYSKKERDEISKVSIYTASSTLDQESLPTRSLMYLMLKISDLPKLKLVSFETRPEYVEDWELKAIKNVLGKDITLEIGIGYETYDPYLRNEILKKGLTRRALHSLMSLLSENKVSLKAYIMLKPHWSLNEEEAIVEAISGIKELSVMSSEYKVPVSIHLNPTYIAKDCQLSEEMISHNYEPPEIKSIITVLIGAVTIGLPIYAGLDDEGMDQWHLEFEKNSPQAHQLFLESLNLSEIEIRNIRKKYS